MRRLLRRLLPAFLLYLLFLLATLPARQLLPLLPEWLHLAEVTGSVWAGSAAQWQAGSLRGGPLLWSLRPLALLGGRLEYDLAIQMPGGSARARLGHGLAGDGYLRDLAWTQDAAGLPALPWGGVRLGGELRLDVELAEFEAGWPLQLDGRLRWQDAALRAPLQLALGNLQARLDVDPQRRLRARIQDDGGPLEVVGSAWLAPDHGYGIDLQLRARPGADAGLVDTLGLLGRPDAAGRHRLERQGRFQW
ncbi:type II secretion system protein N [Thiohalobacter sp. IOR34]|uniref:type II secretion system protein N n=1 Tax=Thiohalobacter sp. IOR34 TaxID=3057176 RepID=UPI0025AF3891|nr:type II secretion system protein N [Thiohalobacter sp. IOR34]WJW75221.1 type II secretion system protein N [Thiohalobacter sp. IOR34]